MKFFSSLLWIAAVIINVGDNAFVFVFVVGGATADHNDYLPSTTTNKHFLSSNRRLINDDDEKEEQQQQQQQQQYTTYDSFNGSISTINFADGEASLNVVDNNQNNNNQNNNTNNSNNNNNNNNGCDESNCGSRRRGWFYNNSFTCYTSVDDLDRMMCADGYKPRIYSEQQQPVVIVADNDEYNTHTNNNNNNNNIKYNECCKTKEGSTLVFVNDSSSFKKPIYPQIIISSIAVISSMVLIIALLIPLFISLFSTRTSNTRSASNASNAGNTGNASNTSTATTDRSSTAMRRRAVVEQPICFSSYNLYLVYLAIPDLMLNLYFVIQYGIYANQKFNDAIFHVNVDREESLNIANFEGAYIVACSTANLYINCVVLQEILLLLRKSHKVKRYDPPSLLKVTLQAMTVYLFSIIVFIIHYFIGKAATEAIQKYQEDFITNAIMYDRYLWLVNTNFIWSILVAYIFPVSFFVYVGITIKCRGYMSSVTGRMKQLVWYFFRIVFVFLLIWLPGMWMVVFKASKIDFYISNTPYLHCVGLLFCSIQPIVSTCMAMTKCDVRKYTIDLITLSYIRTAIASSAKDTRTSENTNDNII